MPFTTEQLCRGGDYALKLYQVEARAIYARELERKPVDDVGLLLRRQYIGFGLMVAIVLVAGHGIGRLLGVW